MFDEVIKAGRVAVITGAGEGIGRECALEMARRGMSVVLVDVDAGALERTRARIASEHGQERVLAAEVDVGSAPEMQALATEVFQRFGDVAWLMNNAVTRVGGGVLSPLADWQQSVQVNIWGVINGVQAFLPGMLDAERPGMVVNVGSKQGITNPPGNSAYNMTKAAVKSFTESLAHDLRNREGCDISAHLLIPGWTTTAGREHKPGAWLPAQVVERMLACLATGDFYMLCPDNEVSLEMDRDRILWAASDITENRPALSRWDPRYKAAFEAYSG